MYIFFSKKKLLTCVLYEHRQNVSNLVGTHVIVCCSAFSIFEMCCSACCSVCSSVSQTNVSNLVGPNLIAERNNEWLHTIIHTLNKQTQHTNERTYLHMYMHRSLIHLSLCSKAYTSVQQHKNPQSPAK